MAAAGVVYPALYTKSTAKKKKGWLDGSVTVSEGFAVLKDENGTEISKVKLGSHESVEANQEEVRIFDGLTCMTLGEDGEAAVPEHKLTRKTRLSMRNVKLCVPRDISNSNGSQFHPILMDTETPFTNTVPAAGGYMRSARHRCINLHRSDAVILEAFEELAQKHAEWST